MQGLKRPAESWSLKRQALLIQGFSVSNLQMPIPFLEGTQDRRVVRRIDVYNDGSVPGACEADI